MLDEGVAEDHIIIIDMESRKNKSFKDPDFLLDWVEKEMKDDSTFYILFLIHQYAPIHIRHDRTEPVQVLSPIG